MDQIKRKRLAKKFGLEDWTKGNYEEGLFDGLRIAEKYYKKIRYRKRTTK